MNRSLFVLALVLCAPAAVSAQEWAQAKIKDSPRHLEWVTVKHGDREVKCYIGFPERSDKAPAVLVIHEIFGHTDWVQTVVDRLAEAGCIAIAPDLLSGMGPNGGGTAELGPEVRRHINNIPATQLAADLDAAAAYALKEPACNGKLAVVGFCWGGAKSFAYAAHNPKLAAALVFYGAAPEGNEIAAIKAPVFGFYGGNDARITAKVPDVTTQMKEAGKSYEAVVYEGAGHGFMRAGEDPKNTNADNVKAHDQAWIRIKGILQKL